MTARVEVDVCRPTASVTMVTVYRVPGCRPLSSADVTVFFRVTFFSRTLSWSISRILNCSVLPGPACQETLRLCEDEGFTWRPRTEEGAAGGQRESTPCLTSCRYLQKLLSSVLHLLD